ncbi:hypothetical protein CDAR_294851 [Caerostris darwini]|uniref:Uncharacterized protein n=1 Tax=Caerostris darwini TaxID=1538125 RepID=A0AAV4UKM5_9ARAC|nr:hypothetical protein CDAR_294851 [Caerostris darwini]
MCNEGRGIETDCIRFDSFLSLLLSVMDGVTGVVQKLSAEECLEVGYPYILPTLSSAAVCPQLPLLFSPNTAEAAATAQSSSILIHRVVTCHRLFL